MSLLTLRLLGSPDIERDGAPIAVDTRKAIALLVYLAMTEGPHRRDALAGLLWPDYDQEHARAALRRTLSALNRALGAGSLRADRSVIALASDNLWLDVREFRDHVAAERGHGHPGLQTCAACIERLTQAASLYRGDFLAGFALRDSPSFDEWQSFEAETLRAELAGVLERLAHGHRVRGSFDAAIEAGRRWLALDPLQEPAHRELMRLYAWSGRRSAALRQYRECVRVVDRELGVAPLAETTELYQEISQGRLPADEVGVRTNEGRLDARPPSPRAYPLVGRGPEWARLLDLYATIEADGRVVVLEGEAGIGKSRLGEEFLGEVSRRGAATVTTKAHEGEAALAYSLFVEALRACLRSDEAVRRLGDVPGRPVAEAARLVPELSDVRPDLPAAPPLEGPGAQSRFFEGVAETLVGAAASTVPAALFFDDLQWADEADLQLLAYLVRRLRGRPVFVLLSWRTEEVAEDHRLRRLVADVVRAGTGSVMRLSRLSKADVLELLRAAERVPVEAMPGLDEQLYRETEGLPFFLTEYLAALEQDGGRAVRPGWMPSGMRALIRSRVSATGEVGGQVLSAAAVIGKSFDFDLLRRVSGRSEDETVAGLEELIRRALVQEVGEESAAGYDFSHEKVREVVYGDTQRARRRLLHGRAAEALAARARGRREGSGVIAHHFQRAGDEAQAAFWHKLAGEHASSLYANSEALAHFRAALALGHPETGALHEGIGDLHTLAGEYAPAAASYEAAAAQRSGRELARIEHKLGRLHHRRGDWNLAESHLAAALEGLGDESAARRASVFADRSLNAHRRGDVGEALRLATRALELAQEAGDVAALAQAHNILGVLATGRGDTKRARDHLETSVALSEDLTDPSARVAALNNLAQACRASGEGDEAVELTRRALEACAAQGDRHRQAALHNNLADLLREQGRSEEAMAHLKTAVAMFAEVGEPGAMEPEIWKLVEW